MSGKTARQLDKTETMLRADIARAYYIDNQSKIEIGRQHSLSRFQVAKMLDEAKELGIVTIQIKDLSRLSSEIEDRLATELGIERVVVVNQDPGDKTDGAEVGVAVIDTLKELIRPNMTLGIAWSRTLDLAARFMPTLPPCDIVQLAGALQMPGSGTLSRIIAQLGQNPGITTYPIYAPLVVDEASTAHDLMRQPEIAVALARADALDLAVVAIGSWESGESSVWEKVSQDDRSEGLEAGAVAEISGRLLDSSGNRVHTTLDDRMIGVRIDQLANAREIIAVARGARRADAVRAAARARLVTCLVVDAELARAILGK